MMKVSYLCGPNMFYEYICLEHDGFASVKAREWVKSRNPDLGAISQVNDLLENAAQLKVPSHLRVWVNAKFPEIRAADFSGRAFGTLDEPVDPYVRVILPYKEKPFDPSKWDDDIPF